MNMRLDVAVPVETFITALKEDVTVGLSVQQHRHALLVLLLLFPSCWVPKGANLCGKREALLP